MKSRLMPWLASFSLLLPLAGCRVASLEGKKISSPPAAAEESGLVYYLTQPQFAVEVKDRHDNKKAEPVYDLQVSFVPDPAQRYAVRLKTGSVTNDVLKLQLREDGRLVSVGSKSEDQTPEIVKALGSLTASALTFSQLGIPIAGTLLAAGPAEQRQALVDSVCTGQISSQEYVDLLCVEQQLANPTSGCSIDAELSCLDPITLKVVKEISLPRPAQKLQRLEGADQDVLIGPLDVIGKLIQARERNLWRLLDREVKEDGLPALEEDVAASQGRLAALRALEARLARRLGREPRHQTLEPPSPRQFEVERIGENLDRVLTRRVQEEARQHIPEDKASHELDVTEKTTLKGDRERLSTLATVAAPVSSDPLARQIAKLEGKIRGRFESREFHDPTKVQTAETESLRDYRTVILLQELRAQLAKSLPPGPRDEIASDLKKKRDEAERQYALFVRGLVSKEEFEKALASYAEAVDRLVAFDERLGATSLTNRRDTLTDFLSRPIAAKPAPTGNESKAFRDFREEHDKVTGEIGARVGGLIDPKKPEEPLPLGSQTSRRLEETVSCVIDREAQIHERGGRLLLLAEIWTRYGKKDAVVLRMRNDRPDQGNSIKCGRDLFGVSSPNAAAGGVQGGAAASPARSAFQRSGMQVRRLRAEDLQDGVVLQGVLVQVPAPYTVITVLQGPAGDRVVQTTTLSLPADDEFLDIGFSGKWLRARELNVKVHTSGALDEYTFDTKQKIDKGAQSLAEATDAVTKSLQEIEKAEQEPAPPDPVTAENTELELSILNLMLKANLDAVREGRPLPYPDLFD